MARFLKSNLRHLPRWSVAACKQTVLRERVLHSEKAHCGCRFCGCADRGCAADGRCLAALAARSHYWRGSRVLESCAIQSDRLPPSAGLARRLRRLSYIQGRHGVCRGPCHPNSLWHVLLAEYHAGYANRNWPVDGRGLLARPARWLRTRPTAALPNISVH